MIGGGKKIMGLPVTVWLGVAAAGLLLGIWLRRKGSSSSSAGSQTSYPLSVPGPISTSPGSMDNGAAGGGLSPDSGVGVDPTVFNELLANETSMIGQLGSLSDAIGALALNIPSSAGSGSSGTGKIPNPDPWSVLGGDDTVIHLPNQVLPAPAVAPVAPATSPAKVASTPTVKAKAPPRYFTFKKNVPLAKGQTLHFTAGRGYYAL